MRIKARQQLGKYRIERKIGQGGFADVYRAYDTIEGIPVALKIPHGHLVSDATIRDVRREVQITAGLTHPNILPIKNADVIRGALVIAYPLGEESLERRLQRRISSKKAISFTQQMMEALTYAHQRRIIHCDVKPENFILFGDDTLKLTDFGIAKVALRTLRGAGTGTLGFIAPEQAMGRPSYRSDVFSVGLIIYRMLSGELPEWPYAWPLPGSDRIRRRFRSEFVEFLRRSLELQEQKRFRDATQMLAAFRRLKGRLLRTDRRRRRRIPANRDWKAIRFKDFRRRFGRSLEVHHECGRCGGPITETMGYCPWCATKRSVHRGEHRFTARCPRCKRGRKPDWRFCPWCFGPGFRRVSARAYSDVRYQARCTNPRCRRRQLMPFMRYCPWCRRKVRRKWKIGESPEKCPRCGWGVFREYWKCCAWCGRSLHR